MSSPSPPNFELKSVYYDDVIMKNKELDLAFRLRAHETT